MKLTYDPQADALYLKLTEAEIDDTIEEEDGAIIDYDIERKIVGIEILGASKLMQYLSDRAPDQAELLPQRAESVRVAA